MVEKISSLVCSLGAEVAVTEIFTRSRGMALAGMMLVYDVAEKEFHNSIWSLGEKTACMFKALVSLIHRYFLDQIFFTANSQEET
jgi:hypothetical protein